MEKIHVLTASVGLAHARPNKYYHSTKRYREISRVCCHSIITSAKHE